MNKLIIFFVAIAAFFATNAAVDLDQLETVAACNEKIAELNKERLELGKETIVRYRKKDHPSKNIEERLKIVEINREFVNSANSKIRGGVKFKAIENNQDEYRKWTSYKNKIAESQKRQERIAEIKKDIELIKKHKEVLVKQKKFH